MRTFLLLLIFFSSVLISGCATEANFKAMLETWEGSHVDSLVSSWGPPASSYPLSSGGQVLEYKLQASGTIPITTPTTQTTYHSGNVNAYGGGYNSYGNYSGTSTTHGSQTTYYNYTSWCNIRLTVNSSGYIERWQYQGNGCRK